MRESGIGFRLCLLTTYPKVPIVVHVKRMVRSIGQAPNEVAVPIKADEPNSLMVKVWDPHREWAERLAEVCYIPEVCDTPEGCADGVDGLIIVDDGSGNQSAGGRNQRLPQHG